MTTLRAGARRLRGRAAARSVFDAGYYRRQYPGVVAADADPFAHFMSVGWAEGRNPCALFDTELYLARNPDVVQAGVNPLVHYLSAGAHEGRKASILFDSDYYLSRNPDLAAARVNPLLHYIMHGAAEGRTASPLFDQNWYVSQYPAAKDQASCPLAHYAERGAREALSPHPLFDGPWYLKRYPDVAAAGMNPLVHYLMRGHIEQRQPHPLFDAEWYRRTYPDVAKAGLNPLVHYLSHGHEEGRQPHPLFDAAWYRATYPDIAKAGMNPLLHFVCFGASEGRNPNPAFDTNWYRRTHLQGARDINPLADYVERDLQRGLPTRPGHTWLDSHEHAPLSPVFDMTVGKSPAELMQLIKAAAGLRAVSRPAVVTVIIPVYEQVGFTLRCVLSLLNSKDKTPFEILIADDQSPDGSGALLAAGLADAPGIRVVINERNLGFLRSCNAAASLERAEFIFLLNNDTVVLDGWLDALVETFRQTPDAGLVGSKLLYPDGRLQEAGGIIWRDASGANFGRGDNPMKPAYNYARDADYISGAAILVDRQAWETVGGFSDEFAPAYYEDTDLAMKMRAIGKRVIYQPLSGIVHYEGISSGTDINSGVKKHQAINQTVFLAKWREKLQAFGDPGDFSRHIVDRRPRGRILSYDAETPTFDRDSGSLTAYYYMRLLSELGYRVTFVPENLQWSGRYSRALQRLGVELIWRPYQRDAREYVLREGGRFDLIMLSRAPIGGAFIDRVREAFPDKPIVFDTVDLHHLRVQRQYELEARPALLEEAQALKALEFNAVRKANVTLLVSDYEAEYLRDEMGPFPHVVLPLIYEPYTRTAAFDARCDIAFVGGYRHPPNIDAVRFLVEEIWPHFRALGSGARLHIIGSHMPAEFATYACEDILVVGFVQDLEDYLNGVKFCVAPLRYGAGVKGKVGNALRMGVPVVGTPTAVEGMGLQHERHVLIAREADGFARAMQRLYTDADLWESLSRQGQKHVLAQFGFDAARAKLAAICANLIG